MPWLKNDIESYFKPGVVYGTAGTKVTVVGDHNDMMIVQDETGNLFSCRTGELTDDYSEVGIPALKSDAEAKQNTGRKKSAGNINQSKLF